jgi:hypothetical protein
MRKPIAIPGQVMADRARDQPKTPMYLTRLGTANPPPCPCRGSARYTRQKAGVIDPGLRTFEPPSRPNYQLLVTRLRRAIVVAIPG